MYICAHVCTDTERGQKKALSDAATKRLVIIEPRAFSVLGHLSSSMPLTLDMLCIFCRVHEESMWKNRQKMDVIFFMLLFKTHAVKKNGKISEKPFIES